MQSIIKADVSFSDLVLALRAYVDTICAALLRRPAVVPALTVASFENTAQGAKGLIMFINDNRLNHELLKRVRQSLIRDCKLDYLVEGLTSEEQQAVPSQPIQSTKVFGIYAPNSNAVTVGNIYTAESMTITSDHSQSIGKNAGSVQIVILCARHSEASAAIRVFEKQGVKFAEKMTSKGYLYHQAVPDSTHKFSLVIFTAEIMGGIAANTLARDALEEFKPQWLLMTGMCAARRGELNLGDVIVAERVADMNEGKDTVGGLARDLHMFEIAGNLRTMVMQINSDVKSWENLTNTARPTATKITKQEVILRVLFDSEEGLKATDICKIVTEKYKISISQDEWNKLVTSDLVPKAIYFDPKKNTFQITDEKRQEVGLEIYFHLRDYPRLPLAHPIARLAPFAVSVSAVVANLNEEKWKQLVSNMSMRTLVGLEMEGSGVYAAVNSFNEGRQQPVKAIIVKGVTDFADPDKDDSFQAYAAEISAAWAFVFLKQYQWYAGRIPIVGYPPQ